MKTKFKSKSKHRRVKDPYGNMRRAFKGMSLLDAMFLQYRSNVLKHSKTSKKTKKTKEITGETKQHSMDIFTAGRNDIYNYRARSYMANVEFQTIMRLDGKLDFDRLKRAVRLSIDAQPVLGSRFVDSDMPHWKRIVDIDENILCSMEEANNTDEAVNRFLESPLDMDNDSIVKVKLVRSADYDVLGVKINHICCDATDAKEYIELLSHIYSRLEEDEGFVSETRICSKEEQERVFAELAEIYTESREASMTDTQKSLWQFPWKERGEESIGFTKCRLSQRSLESIRRYGKSRNATVNDMILTAFYRTMFKISQPEYGVPMDISSTADLRRYLSNDKTRNIRNLSGGFTTRIDRVKRESFEGTLFRVANSTRKIKEDGIYFNDYFDHISKTSRNEDSAGIGNVCLPGLSNLGVISKSLIRFGNNTVTEAYFVPPVVRTPGLMLFVSAYNDMLTMSAGYSRASTSQKDMKTFLVLVRKELLRGCGYLK